MTTAASKSHARTPVVRLRPKTGGRFFAGAPWVYANELVMDRRSRALAPGTIATLEDSDRVAVATVALNMDSKIAARRLDAPGATIDADWLRMRLSSALALRERLFDQPFYRWVHAEADGLPGLVIDRFGEAVVVQPNAAWVENLRTALLSAIDQTAGPAQIVWNGASRARALEGLPQELRLLKGEIAGPVRTPMNGAVYLADLLGGQKTGLFYDQRPNHEFSARLAKGGRMLDVFSHVGGFGLAALAAGAAHATLVDGSEPALTLAAEAAGGMGVADRLDIRRGDAFDVMRELGQSEDRFDLVVCDPPAFAPNKSALDQGLRAYAKTARLGAGLTISGGFFVLCSCSHAVDLTTLQGVASDALRRLKRTGRLIHVGGAGADHPVHPHLGETGYLKALFYQLD
ncbi:MAG: class I SAM-dependent rRNA methyltransferase [Pseudomonadota bacterium]